MQSTPPVPVPGADYGLRRGILSPLETLAQSVSTVAPTTTPAATIPLVCALAGNGTWLAYVLATVAIFLVALCIARYARHSSSPGSLYTYASMTLPPWLSATVAWSLLLAYVATGSSVIGGFYHYANVLLRDATGHVFSAVLLALLVTGVSIWIAYRDVKISARLMLWIEAASVSVIVVVIALVLFRHGWHWDGDQLHLRGMSGSGLRLGLVLALFSFVGFESATTLGAEARDPLRTIPRAVIQSSVLTGAFFTVCAYSEVMGFHSVGGDLGASQAPMYVLANVGGVPVLGLLIDIGALVSLFAGTLACITAAARVLLRMAHDGPEAVLILGTFRRRLILLDIGLPGMNGYEVARALRADPVCTGVVLVALTGWGAEEDRRRSHDAGFDHHMVKPVDPHALMRLLAELNLVKS